jgi:phage minor structural protein
MLIITNRNLQTLTIVSNDYPDGVHFQDDKFNENLETGTCMLTCSIDKVVEKDVELIEAGCLIVAVGYKKKPVLLEITEVVETRYSKEIVAEDCGLDLLNEDIAEQDFKGTLVEWVNNTLGEKSDWVVGINEAKDKNLAFKFDDTTTKTKRLAMIAGRFGCEISYDVKLNGNAIDKKVINFYKKRGKETGYRLEFGRDVSDVKRTVSIADLCTAVRPVGKPHKEQIREVKQVEIEEHKKKPVPNSKIELFVKWMKSREGKVRYSQARREGPNYYDCSSSVSSAAKFAGLFPKSVGLPTTETLWDWGNAGTYFHQIKQSEIEYGDIFVSRYNGKGHTGVILDKNTIIHCTLYGSINGIVTTKLRGWTGPNVRFYRWNENKGGTIVDATKKTYWTNSDVTKHDLGKRLQGITATQINNWIRAKAPNSPFNGQGQVFIEAQKQSGLDARYILAHAALESAWGSSRIGRTYHNYFGINAYDSNPDNAKKSSNRSLQAGIINGAVWIKEHYYNRGQKTLYAMNHDRNGHNYASDKAWGDKIANIMKSSERFTSAGATASSTEQVTYKEREVNTDLVGYKYDDGRFYVTDDGLICDREAAKKWTRFNKSGQKYFIRMYDSEATSQKTLFDEGLRFLKNNNEAKISYEVSLRQLPSELEIGDYIRIIDHGFKPALYLSARLVDITRSLCDELSNSAIFANFEEQKAGISERLLSLEKSVYSSRFNWQNVPYEMQLSSSQGNVFKDGVLSTEITAIVTKAGVDQTATIDKFVWERVSEYQDKITTSDEDWNKSKEGSVGNILGINNTDVDLQATFTCSAMLNDVAVATSFITIKDLTIGIYKQEKEPDRASLSWGDVWQWDDGKGNHFKRLWKGDRWEDTITKRDLELLELTPGPPGADGENGMPGEDGKDGRTSYMHFAYADSADGTVGFTRTATSGKKYIGFYTDFEKTDSTDPKRYEWSKYVGEDGKNGKDGSDGIPGKAGADGKTPYFHTAWSNSADGTKDFSTNQAGEKEYIGTYTDYVKADSTDPKKYTWMLVKGNKGKDGADGANGSNFTWNMLLKSNVGVENDKYNINNYDLSGDFVVGEDYTLTIWGKLGEDRTRFDFYNSESYVRLEGATEISQGVYSVSFKWKDTREYNGVVHKGDNSKLLVYAYPSGGKSTSRIDKIKLEKGINSNPVWSPHISEINGKDGIDGKDGTFTGEIGGRNLIRNSDKITGWTKYDGGNHLITDEYMEEFNIQGYRVKSDAANATDFIKTYVNFDVDDLVVGKTYTFSVYVKNNRDVTAQLRVNGFNWNFAYKLNANECKRFVVTGKRDSMDGYWKNRIQFQLRSANKAQFVDMTVSRPQLEEGDVATSWSKNPSDFEDELEKKADSQTVTDIESRQQAVEVLISQKADKDSVTKSFAEIEKAKAYADTVKKALENENLSLKDRIKIIEENVGAGKFTIDAITTYFDFGEEGILIGKKDEAVKMILKNNALEIIDGTKTVARFANSQVQVPNLKVDGVLEFGYHMVTKYDNGTNKYTIIKPI